MANEFEYYFISRANNPQHPLLIADTDCPPYLRTQEYIENPETMAFCLGKPIPRKPKMVDYHSTPDSVISKKIFDVLDNLNVKGIQLIPTIITGKNDEIYENYWYIHIINHYSVIDKENSECEWNTLGKIRALDKLVLDEEKLKPVPLDERLIFRMPEYRVEPLFHKSVVDAIMANNPEGVVFYNVKEWNQSQQFD
ncbi:hypothetical protein FACS1894172_20800 [Spirochaetia bacterium]|nr:hypothetical protein FACS1894164_17980 [Spirochaetia bacterium]GHU37403.1 hypothetical protein FACS1894172_20800 [Spirochaetia bacterium]